MNLNIDKYFSFDGRINRLSYFLQILLMVVITFVVSLLLALIGMMLGVRVTMPIYMVGVLGTIYGLALAARRLHDMDKSAWWLLLMCLPIVNFIFGLVLLFARGTTGPNRFGPDPLAPVSGPSAQ